MQHTPSSPAQLALLSPEPWELSSPVDTYSSQDFYIQERREFIVGTEPVTEDDIVTLDVALDALGDILDTFANHANPEYLTPQARLVARCLVALKMREVKP